MRKLLNRFFYVCVALIGIGGTLIMVFIFELHLPSIAEIKFHWQLTGVIDSPQKIKKLTNFPWQRMCIRDDANGWPIDRSKRSHFVIEFFNGNSTLIDKFHLNATEHPYLEPHLNGCFASEQNFFYRIGV